MISVLLLLLVILQTSPTTPVFPFTPKIGMGKPAISKRKFSSGRSCIKQVCERVRACGGCHQVKTQVVMLLMIWPLDENAVTVSHVGEISAPAPMFPHHPHDHHHLFHPSLAP